MKNYIFFLQKKLTLVIIGCAFGVLCLLANTLMHQDYTYLTQTFNYSPDKAYDLLQDIGESGRAAHFRILFVDIAMVFLYTNFLFGANYRIWKNRTDSCIMISVITFCPIILALVQLSEVALVMDMVINYSDRSEAVATVANLCTMVKYVLTVTCFLLPLIGLCANIIDKIKKRTDRVAG